MKYGMKNAISVVIPAYNEEKLLPQCLDSLNRQDYRGDYEIIVVDNDSADATARIATEFGARVVSCPERGVAYARQAGAQATLGEIIVQADADTLYPADWLSRIARHFTTDQKSAALAGVYVYQDGPRWAWLEYSARYLLNMAGVLLLRRPVAIPGANFAFRREAFMATEGYNPEALYPDQWGISYSLSRRGKVAYVRTLKVFTSTRRVQEPFLSLVYDVFLSSIRLLARFIQYNTRLLRAPAPQEHLRKSAAKRVALGTRLEKVLSK